MSTDRMVNVAAACRIITITFGCLFDGGCIDGSSGSVFAGMVMRMMTWMMCPDGALVVRESSMAQRAPSPRRTCHQQQVGVSVGFLEFGVDERVHEGGGDGEHKEDDHRPEGRHVLGVLGDGAGDHVRQPQRQVEHVDGHGDAPLGLGGPLLLLGVVPVRLLELVQHVDDVDVHADGHHDAQRPHQHDEDLDVEVGQDVVERVGGVLVVPHEGDARDDQHVAPHGNHAGPHDGLAVQHEGVGEHDGDVAVCGDDEDADEDAHQGQDEAHADADAGVDAGVLVGEAAAGVHPGEDAGDGDHAHQEVAHGLVGQEEVLGAAEFVEDDDRGDDEAVEEDDDGAHGGHQVHARLDGGVLKVHLQMDGKHCESLALS